MAAQFHLTATKVSMPASITANQLGESPCWDETFGYLWWIDILGEAIYLGRPCPNDATDFDRAAKIPLPGHRPGFVVPTANVFSTNNSEQCKPTHCSTLDGARIDVAGPDAHKSRECIWIAHRTKYQSAQHAVIWGSQKGLFLSYFKEGAPWVEDLVLPADAVNERGELWLDVKMSAMSTITLNPFPSHTVPLASQGREFRFNDGKVAPGGTLFSGALMERTAAHPQRVAGSGCLLQWIPWGGVNSPVQVSAPTDAPKDEKGAPKGRPSHSRVALGDLTISNGMGWSSDGSVFFHVDTASHAIMQYSYDVETHVLRAGSGKAFWKLPDDLKAKGAVLDGLCVDDDNHVWVALAGYGRVVRLQGQPKSNQLATIVGEVIVEGVPLVTSCCFGGPERNTLYITTAKGTSAAQVAACTAPDAGCLFAVRLGSIARGAPPHPAHLSERTLHALRRLSTGSKL